MISFLFQTLVEDIDPATFLLSVSTQGQKQNAIFAENYLTMSNVESSCMRQSFCKIASISGNQNLFTEEQHYAAKVTIR